LPTAELWSLIEVYLKKEGIHFPAEQAWKDKSVETFKSAMEVISDAVPLYKLLDDQFFVLHSEAAEVLSWETSTQVITAWRDLLAVHPKPSLTESDFLKIQDEVKNRTGAKGKNLFMPIRVAVIGKPHGTELKILVPLMTKDSLILRAEKTLSRGVA
jgi:nondiscriminating glutamyl-tRNA synthetase